ncbi:MAG TPA: tripartite tricarboxylate transporter substrate-binding protein [Burkholderiales bacterium]|nr:tripartite tricarboxylate transporter substrate-binding protein [Burkholderiales bacterium]
MKRMLFVLAASMLALGALAADPVTDYPLRPVRLINPFPPGGSSDPSCRLLADALTKSLGQQFVVDNRGGGNGNIGTAIAAKATPDGHVLVFASGTTFTVNPYVYSSLGFDPKKDLAPIVKFGSVPNVLVIHPSLPARTLAEFTQYVKAHPDQLNYASAGNGSSMHLAAELYQKMTGTRMRHIPYVSPGLATQDTMANRTQLIFHLLPAIAQQVNVGNLRALTVLSATRSSALPDVPATAEAGMPGLEAGTWYAVFTPSGTPRPIVAKLNQQINAILAEPAFRKRVIDMGVTPMGGTPEDVTSYIASESRKWSEVVRTAGIKVD